MESAQESRNQWDNIKFEQNWILSKSLSDKNIWVGVPYDAETMRNITKLNFEHRHMFFDIFESTLCARPIGWVTSLYWKPGFLWGSSEENLKQSKGERSMSLSAGTSASSPSASSSAITWDCLNQKWVAMKKQIGHRGLGTSRTLSSIADPAVATRRPAILTLKLEMNR